MKIRIAAYILLLISAPLFSQNLVPNESFETIKRPSERWMGDHSDFRSFMSEWHSPNQGSPDVLHVDYLDKLIPKRPNVEIETHRPRTGNVMVGIKTFGCKRMTQHCKEYLQIRLKAPLLPGVEYYGEFYVNPISTSMRVHDIGMAFSDSATWQPIKLGIYNKLASVEQFDLLESPVNEWVKISGNFRVNDFSNFLLIGSFQEDEYVLNEMVEGGLEYSYYLIDDVLVKPLEPILLQDSIVNNQKLTLNHLLFDFNKATLQESSFKPLEQLAFLMNNDFTFDITITGHTDNVGGSSRNLTLSKNRAESVKQFLLDNGIEESRLIAEGKGAGEPIASNDSEEGREKNRRVEILIRKK